MSGLVFFFKQKTAYEMRNSDWSSDVCSSDLRRDRQLDIGGRRPGDADAVAGRLLRPGQEGGEDADGRGLAVVPTGGDAVLRLLHLRDQRRQLPPRRDDFAMDIVDMAEVHDIVQDQAVIDRSEERRVGQECVCTSRSRW